ncbi:MAG: DUF4340 domain-containing protein [Puniceicoccales bacterium]|jgi:hypothetical protein|nr:DUF4340 domain-containing protein [Puniceicoccales bacterium]
MKWMHTLVLLFVVFGLWIFNWKLWRYLDFASQTVSDGELYRERSIQKISITFKQKTIVIEKKPHHTWYLTQPFHWPANPFALGKFFQILAFEKELPPKAEIVLEKPDGTEVTFRSNEKKSNIFCETGLLKILKQGIAFWCEQRLCLQKLSEIDQIDMILHRTQQKFSLIKNGSRWEFLSPIAIEADGDAVQKFLEYVVSMEVSPFIGKNSLKDSSDRINFESTMAEKKNFEITMTIGDIRRQQLCVYLKKKVFDAVSQRDVYLGCLGDGKAYFFIPPNEVFDHPLQSLCHRSLFPEIHSVALSYRGEKLFLSCDEAGKWNAFKLSEKETVLRLLENFDEKAILLYLLLIRPLDVIEKSTLGSEWDGEKLVLEINETLKFELGIMKNETYLISDDKHYAVKIDRNLMPKLVEFLEKE